MLKIEKLNPLKQNYLSVGDKEFFITKRDDKYTLLPAKCSHRGGPLFFAEKSEDNIFMICPWHKNKFKPCVLSKAQIPTVFIKDSAYVVVLKSDVVLTSYKNNLNIL